MRSHLGGAQSYLHAKNQRHQSFQHRDSLFEMVSINITQQIYFTADVDGYEDG
ncbi:hypothetical protein GCM10027170_23360 [Aliiglaciecola aliphaticivorans]